MGTWEPAVPGDTAPGEVKILAEKQWFVRFIDPDTRKLEYAHGGTYTFDGKVYVETVEWASGATAQLSGQKFTFNIKLNPDGTFTQTGVGNPYTVTYRPAK